MNKCQNEQYSVSSKCQYFFLISQTSHICTVYSSVHCTQCNTFIHNELGQSTVYQSVHNVQFTSYCEGQTFILF